MNVSKRWTPRHWASLMPFGIGHQRPNNYMELVRALRENWHERKFAWRILNEGCCDGCALGTTGMTDWTLDGIHLCNIRLRLLKLNTMPALDTALLGDVAKLRALRGDRLRDLGRLPYPMLRRAGDAGYTRISWDDALEQIAQRIRTTTPDRIGFYVTSRGMPNEAYYCTQKAVRAMGSNNIDNAARICHSPSTSALKYSVGATATTCSYTDWIKSDLIVFVGSNVANNQPVATKYLHYAKKHGAKIVMINNYREPGMERYWIPSAFESALFGTKLADMFYLVNIGSDIAFLNGAMKQLIAQGGCDEDFLARHTDGFEELKRDLEAQSWEDLEAACGLSRDAMREFADMIAKARRAVFVWSMGITQHEHGVANVRAIINLALSKGFVGREGCGLMPIRGHSGVQGGAEMGAYSTAFPGGLPINAENAAALSRQWGFDVPADAGITAPEMIDAAHERRMDVLFSVGGNFLEVLPEPDYVEEALSRIPLRVHMDITLSSQMLADCEGDVLLLPATTRYETAGGVTQTSTERRIIFSPEIPGRRVGEARPEWEAFLDLARRVKPELAKHLSFNGTAAVRNEIAEVVPMYAGIERLQKAGDQFQYGGSHLCADWNFKTPDGKAHFSIVRPPNTKAPEGSFLLTTRRGKQFNSMVQEHTDAITGAGREAVLISAADAARHGIANGAEIVLLNDIGELRGRAYIAPVKEGNLQVHWPEGNVLLDRHRRSREAGVPDYNAVVRLELCREDAACQP